MENSKYPADFDEEQCLVLDAAIEAGYVDEDDEPPFAFGYFVDRIRKGDYEFLRGVYDEYDLGYSYRDIVGLDENLEFYFDWAKFGRDINIERGGDFTTHGWLTFN